ncbi:MAG: ABC transporter ATP-binding protein [Planctomycetota bacterium]
MALRDLTLDVEDGELLVLVGPSGCGKTTTLRLIAGLESITSGRICIDGFDVTHVAPKDRDIAMVFQNYALYPHMNVFKNLAFGLKMRRTPRAEIERRVHEVADKLGIRELLDRKPATLSGGQRQRVALGRAIIRKPRVYLLDEPLSNLDARLRIKTRSEIRSLQQFLRATMIYVTHDQEEAMTVGDRVAVLDVGILQQCDTSMDIYQRPANAFVAQFFGQPSMNMIRGRIVRAEDHLVFESACGTVPLHGTASAALIPCVDRAILFGIRPEHVRVREAHAESVAENSERCADEEASPVFSATVDHVEPLGVAVNLYVQPRSGDRWVVRVSSGSTPLRGQRVNVSFDMRYAHFFEADAAGQRIL